jgi:1-acyl-sn-glycerol-3-phosphate acyltransferase
MIKKSWFVNFCLGFLKLTGYVPAWLFFKPKVHLAEGASRRLPKGCILVSNHQSLLDFVLYLIVFPFRSIRFLMAEVLFSHNKLLSTFLYCVGGIKVDRDGKNFGFISNSLEVLDQGGTVGIFPQGRLPVNGKPFPFTPSTAFIALHTDKPIVPVYTAGGYGLFKRSQVVIGAPVYVAEHFLEMEEKQRLQALTELLEKTVYDLKEEI